MNKIMAFVDKLFEAILAAYIFAVLLALYLGLMTLNIWLLITYEHWAAKSFFALNLFIYLYCSTKLFLLYKKRYK